MTYRSRSTHVVVLLEQLVSELRTLCEKRWSDEEKEERPVGGVPTYDEGNVQSGSSCRPRSSAREDVNER